MQGLTDIARRVLHCVMSRADEDVSPDEREAIGGLLHRGLVVVVPCRQCTERFQALHGHVEITALGLLAIACDQAARSELVV